MKKIRYAKIIAATDSEWIVEALTEDGGTVSMTIPRTLGTLIEETKVAFVPKVFVKELEASLNVMFVDANG